MREQKQRRSAESRRHAGVLLQQLRWLTGFPDEEGWRTARGELVVIDGPLLSRSRRAARTALREHREELAALVGDLDRWWRIVDAALSWCSAPDGELDLLDHATPRTVRAARDVIRHSPELRSVIIAAGVAWAFAPDELARAIPWIAAHPELAALPTASALALVQLALLDGAGAETLLQLFALDAPHPVQSIESVEHLSGWLRGQQHNRKNRGKRRQQPRDPEAEALREAARLAAGKKAPQITRTLPKLEIWLAALLVREPAAQRRALALLAVAELPAAARTWIDWENASAPRRARATEFAERGFDLREEWSHYERIQDGLTAVIKAVPSRFWLPDVLDYVIDLADKPHSLRFFPAVMRLLKAQPLHHAPVGVAWRAHVLCHLARMVNGTDHPRLVWFWEELAAALERGASSRLLGPWLQALGANHWCWFDEEMVEAPCKRADIHTMVLALVALAERGELDSLDASNLHDWMLAGLSQPHAVEIVELLRNVKLSRTSSVELKRGLLALIGPSPAELVASLKQSCDVLRDAAYLDERHLSDLFTRASAAGLSWLLRAALAEGQGETLLAISSSLSTLPKTWWLDSPMPAAALSAGAALSSSSSPLWITRYPATLAPALHRLASIDPDAEASAKRRVSSVLPDPSDLTREAESLRARAPLPPRLATRLANLEARLATPPVPSPQRLARLAEKLEQAAVSIGLARLASVTHAEATARLLRAFGLERWPEDWPTDRKTVHAVQALQRLDSSDRQLAGRLLRARTGPPPWDLRDEPINRRFLENLRRRGLTIEPWLDDSPTTIHAAGPLELALCSDPLQIFQMGGHFDTCLSPGAGNFFSTVSNAADINKRVLYARRAGRVVGRCLLALTDDARILTFHPYCHESIDFPEIIATFARSLAARMDTEVSSSGTVSKLLCDDWYDDGARDLVGRFAALRDEKQLPLDTIEPPAFLARLRELLGRPLDDVTLPSVLALSGLRQRPELVLALSPSLLALSSPDTRVAAAVLAFRAGSRDLADLLLADHGATIHPSDHFWDASELLANLRPSILLARIRATRERGSRGWRSESPFRLILAGTALEALHRPRQAITLYRLALSADLYYLRDDLTARLARLSKHIRD